MTNTNAATAWRTYCDRELAALTPLLTAWGYSLDERQPHLGGERYLMQAVASVSGLKVILLGRRLSDSMRVVIKASSEEGGKNELAREHECREVLQKIGFAYHTFISPDEIQYQEVSGLTISITKFIEQESTFLARPLREQFKLALAAFKAQESAHATTREHEAYVRKHFITIDAAGYRAAFQAFDTELRTRHVDHPHIETSLAQGLSLLTQNLDIIDQYAGFLTHVDFVPHNIRVSHGTIYLLDHSSLRFGSKYEGWARFLNFMLLYNPELEHALVEYVRLNRTPEEVLVLRLMRIFRLGEILVYYTKTLDRSTGNLLKLNMARINFWAHALQCMTQNSPLPDDVRAQYIAQRDALRTPDELDRQRDLH